MVRSDLVGTIEGVVSCDALSALVEPGGIVRSPVEASRTMGTSSATC
jgi:hypothetical protein